MKGTTAILVTIFVISLVIWTAFSLTSYPLDELSTVVVVGAVGLAAFAVRWVVANAKRKKEKGQPHE